MILGNLNYCCLQLSNNGQYSQLILWPWRFVIICLRMELNSVFPQHQNIVIKGRTIFCEVSLCCVSSHAYLLRPTKGAENCTVGAAEKYNTTGNSLNKSHTRLFTVIYFQCSSSLWSCFVYHCKIRDCWHLTFSIPWWLTEFVNDLHWCCLWVVEGKEKAEWEDKYNSLWPLSFPVQPKCTATDHGNVLLPHGACGGHQERCRQRASKLAQVFPSQIQLRNKSNWA